ncbi:non-homologous end-joining DNA ligase [Methylosinus sp. Sm6]|uniref:non-homologous end-joining DNA ligase n=1 Tax=Methylosinus sp. Sm6 TaxID=2866948 RepID=UPI001C99546D|nr:non-homologous end-joining DNA ligase [Methylosinus sp. Sm6]MBY6241954.1 non-homologous end-joining DNA ligase [Methylosinus sp. Sm6]
MIARSATASLAAYRAKRDFTRTREPRGETPRAAAGQGAYVVQKHRARRTHFDLRLELDGALESWAVTRGPSLDPSEKRLAVRTEDHPLDYAGFEGAIPQGEYGAGEVMLWDRGRWSPVGDARSGIERGHFKFTLAGERLKGGFALTRLPRRGKERRENWLLVKEKDRFADPDVDPIREWTKSVVSGRGFAEIAAGDAWPAPLPKFRAPQLATLAHAPPSGADWLHEIKFDGYRAIVAAAGGAARAYTRSGLDWTDRFARIAEAVAQLPMRSALVDGEIVATDECGRSDFGRLQKALEARADVLIFYVFDLLEIDGEDISKAPLVERKARLAELTREAPAAIRYSDHLRGGGPRFLEECCRMKLEGVVSKRADRPYVSGRTLSWIKTKCVGRDEFVVGGYRPSAKDGRAFASLLIGEYEGRALRYRGRVGAGFSESDLARLAAKLRERKISPFAELPRDIARAARFVEPRLVVEIAYAERTSDGVLRHPRFVALREDKPAKEVAAARDGGGKR